MENIEVAIRIRPINFSELSNNDMEIWDSLSEQTIGISNDKYNELLRCRKIIPGQKTSYNFSKFLKIYHFPIKNKLSRLLLQSSLH